MRGSLTLFKDLFGDELSTTEAPARKGRSDELDNRRNECLVARYFFFGKNNLNWGYDALIKEVAEQFFLSTMTVHNILQANYRQLAGLKKENPPKHYFAKRWPHLVW